MAMRINKTFDNGLSIADMYVKLVGFSGNKDILRFLALYYINEESYKLGKPPLCDKEFFFAPNQGEASLRWDRQAYEYAKTNIPEFIEAIEC